jgi:hypothetical protein
MTETTADRRTASAEAEAVFTARVTKAKKIADVCVNVAAPPLGPLLVAGLDASQRHLLETLAGTRPASDTTWDLVIEFVIYYTLGLARECTTIQEDE